MVEAVNMVRRMTPAERQYARNRATNTRAMGHTVTNEHALAADVLALDAALTEAEEEIFFTEDRGDHLVYRDEWEQFDRWQRARAAAAETTT
jgi:hypothetical protein